MGLSSLIREMYGCVNDGKILKIKLSCLISFMKRVYCNSILIKGSTYHLEEKYYIHLIRVMRLNIGDELTKEVRGRLAFKESHLKVLKFLLTMMYG